MHKTDLGAGEVVLDGGRRCRSPRRCGRPGRSATLEPVPDAVAMLDGMVSREGSTRRGHSPQALLGRRGRWGSRARRDVRAPGRRRSDEPARVLGAGRVPLRRPARDRVPQFDVVVERGVFLGQVDLAWPEARLVVEYEGAVPLRRSCRSPRTTRRYERLVAAGWRVIRLSAADLRDLDAVVERIRAALDEPAPAWT